MQFFQQYCLLQLYKSLFLWLLQHNYSKLEQTILQLLDYQDRQSQIHKAKLAILPPQDTTNPSYMF